MKASGGKNNAHFGNVSRFEKFHSGPDSLFPGPLETMNAESSVRGSVDVIFSIRSEGSVCRLQQVDRTEDGFRHVLGRELALNISVYLSWLNNIKGVGEESSELLSASEPQGHRQLQNKGKSISQVLLWTWGKCLVAKSLSFLRENIT